MNRAKKIALWTGLALLIAVASSLLAILIFVRTEWLEALAKARIVRGVEDATGGRAQTGNVTIDIFRLTTRIDNFVLRGSEPPGEPPLVKAKRVEMRLEFGALIRGDFRVPLLTVERPEINILVDEAGKSNIPEAAVPAEGTVIESLVDTAIGRLTIRNGVLRYDSRQIPLTLRGENVNGRLDYVPARPGYDGSLTVSALRVDAPQISPLTFDARTDLAIFRDRIQFSGGRLAKSRSLIRFAGRITQLNPFRAAFDLDANLAMADVAQPLNVPLNPQGRVRFTGRLGAGGDPGFLFTGRVYGDDLAARRGTADIGVFRFDSNVRWDPKELVLPNLRLSALGGTLTSRARVIQLNHFVVQGTFRGFSLQELSRRLDVIPRLAWSGDVSGRLFIQGKLRGKTRPALKGNATLNITPAPGPKPIEGLVILGFDQPAGRIDFGNSYLQTAESKLEFSGALGGVLQVSLESRDPEELMPVIAMFTDKPPDRIPITIQNGAVTFQGTVTGPLGNPIVQGAVEIEIFAVGGRQFDHFHSGLVASSRAIALHDIMLTQNQTIVRGELEAGLQDWAVVDASSLAGSFRIEGADVQVLLAETGEQWQVSGTLEANVVLAGTVGNPVVAADVDISQPAIAGQPFDQLTAQLHYEQNTLQITDAEAASNGSSAALQATYTHAPRNWRTGLLHFDLTATGLDLARIQQIQEHAPGLAGRADLQSAGALRVVALKPEELVALNADLTLAAVSMDGRPWGGANLTARTEGGILRLQTAMDFQGAAIQGSGDFQLAGDVPGQGQLQIGRLDFGTLADLLSAARPAAGWPFSGFLTGNVSFRGPLLSPKRMTAEIRLDTVRLMPRDPEVLVAGERAGMTLQNVGPVLLTADRTGIQVQQGRFIGRDTDIVLSGGFAFGTAEPWNLRAVGTVNLVIVQAFQPDLLASGEVVLDMVVRGSLGQPALGGQAKILDASLHHANFATGLSEASGLVLFQRNRAVIDTLTGRVGGGLVEITGLVGVSEGRFLFNLHAEATEVRARHPPEIGTTFDATLSLTGTSDRSLLSGLITVERVVVSPQADLGELVATTARPVVTPAAPNEFLQSVHLDINLETAPNAELISSLAERLHAEADLNIRGTAASPSLLGRVDISEGEIQFFGSTYTIAGGEIGFYNPVRIEPVLNLNVETTARGVVVAITFAGPLDRLQVTYRSDPPLETADIVALLAIGRDPAALDVGIPQTATSAAMLQAGATNLLGQALADPVTSRIQRLFGLSRLNIDPSVGGLGLDTIPQARVTIEQQISRDITLTYSTDLTDAQAQVVRLEWDVSPRWSVVAVRDQNGFFGVDFLVKRAF
ncbi:MAG: translocation/assembly module TamB domain-containing protein [Bryobacteraceae bacterium]